MQCMNCFKEYQGEVCPHCGHGERANNSEIRSLPEGSILCGGKYIIGTVIGSGGFGVTYNAYNTVLKTRVAVKEYLPGEFSTRSPGTEKISIYGGEKSEQYQEGLAKFLEESRRLAKFHSVPGIVQVFDVFEANETAYIVMEYLEGETLGERLKKESKIDYKEAIQIMIPILQALESVHREGILHRDIAPDNIFLCSNGDVKLLDFGAARSATGTHSKSLTVLYKEGYTPEEQYRSRGNQGPWTDVYSCAATMYRMITGIVPEGAMERRRKDNLKKPSSLGVKIPNNVERGIMNALNLEIGNRTGDAGAFLQELLGEKNVDDRFKRIKEKRRDKIPIGVWIGSTIFLASMSVILAMLFAGRIQFIGGFSSLFLSDGEVRVINIVNMEERQAEEKLRDKGLILDIEDYRYSNKIDEGKIIVQKEEKGSIVKTGSTIHVIVSKGAGNVEVPEMVGLKFENIQMKLEELCLEYEIEEVPGNEAPGYVVEQDIKSGIVLEQGSLVKIKVSQGNGYSTGSTVVLEDMSGLDYQQEKINLGNQQIYLQISDYLYDDNIPKGGIISQDKETGASLNGGDLVEVVVSMGLEPMEVPQLMDLSLEEATSLLEKSNLTPVVNYVVNMDLEEGIVLAQGIEGGRKVDKFSEIPLDVCSHGSVVPDFTGKTDKEAEALAKENNLTITIKRVFDGNNTVKAQDIEAGEVVDLGSNVSLQIGIPRDEFTAELVEKINAVRMANGLNAVSLSGTWSGYAQDLAPRTPEGTSFNYASYVKSSYDYFYWTWFAVSDTDTAAARIMTYPNARRNFDLIGIGYSGGQASIILGKM